MEVSTEDVEEAEMEVSTEDVEEAEMEVDLGRVYGDAASSGAHTSFMNPMHSSASTAFVVLEKENQKLREELNAMKAMKAMRGEQGAVAECRASAVDAIVDYQGQLRAKDEELMASRNELRKVETYIVDLENRLGVAREIEK